MASFDKQLSSAIKRLLSWAENILEALEPLGIVHSLVLSSLYSGGIHIYLPFAEAQKCGSLAMAIAALVKHVRFKFTPSILELFPDLKPYIPNSTPQLYAAYRLPLQSVSYLLMKDWEPISAREKI